MKGIKRVVRIKLTDFIESSHENDILDKLNSIQKYGGVQIKLWYNSGDIEKSQLENFKKNYKQILNSGSISIIDTHYYNEFVWYEISCRNNNNTSSNYKFCSLYNDSSDIILCLKELESFIKFSSTK